MDEYDKLIENLRRMREDLARLDFDDTDPILRKLSDLQRRMDAVKETRLGEQKSEKPKDDHGFS